MLGVVALGDDFGGLRLTLDGAGDGFLRGGVVVILDLGVVAGVPVNEHADANEQIVGFRKRDDALGPEPPRVCRRPFCLSHAAMAGSSSCA